MTEKEKALIEAKANILKALGHPTRLWMAEQAGRRREMRLRTGGKHRCRFFDHLQAPHRPQTGRGGDR